MKECENCHKFYTGLECPYCKNDVQVKKKIAENMKLQHSQVHEEMGTATINRQAISFETNLIPVGEIKEMVKMRKSVPPKVQTKKKMNKTLKIVLIVFGSIFAFLIALILLVLLQLSL